jgi:OFA family oxalate/formate antiporter-like MFS transporter
MDDFPLSKRLLRAILPAFLLAVSVGQIYAFTNYASEIAEHIGRSQKEVQFAFSLGIFFLGMGAAFFGKIVERNIRLSTIIGTAMFLGGMLLTGFGVSRKSLLLIYLGYGFLLGTGTGIIYISPVKTMMMWFPKHKALAAALPIISFGLGSTLSTALFQKFSQFGIIKTFLLFAITYAIPMIPSCFLLKKPFLDTPTTATAGGQTFTYGKLLKDFFFIRSWLFMFLNISAGLCLIPLAKQMMKSETVNYSPRLIAVIVALSGLMNGGGRFAFALWSDHLKRRINILLLILSISVVAAACSYWPLLIGLTLLVINACYGAGFSVIPAILAEHYGMGDISKIHGAVLSAWGFAGLVGNQAAILVSDKLGLGFLGVVTMLVIVYALNLGNAFTMRSQATPTAP